MADFLKRLNQLDTELGLTSVHEQVSEINSLAAKVARQEVLLRAPRSLGLAPDIIEKLTSQVPEKKKQLLAVNNLLNNLRQFLAFKYGVWSLPNLKAATLITEKFHVKTALEIMAGNGYWSKALSLAGAAVIATDSLEWAKTSQTGKQQFFPVKDCAATQAIKDYPQVDLIICSWAPNFRQNDLAAVAAWRKYNPKATLLFVGEASGATNSPHFWQVEHFAHSAALKAINRAFVSYDFIEEQIYEIEHEL